MDRTVGGNGFDRVQRRSMNRSSHMRVNRRLFLGTAAAAASVGLMPQNLSFAARSAPTLSIAPFRFDVTSPIGHSMCGGWIKRPR